MQAPEIHALDALIEQTLRHARLRGTQRARVARELRAHVEDALDVGVPLAEIAAGFGDPEIVGSLIRRHPPVRRSRSLDAAVRAGCTAATVLGLALAFTYVQTASRLETFRRSSPPNSGLDSLARVAQTKRRIVAALDASRDETANALATIDTAVATARRLSRSVDLFEQAIGAEISLEVLDASNTIATRGALSDAERVHLATGLRSLVATGVPVDSTRERAWIAEVARRSFDGEHRPTAEGLRVAQAMKGVRRPTLRARLLEPLLFADSRSAHRRWTSMVGGHFADARRAHATFHDRIEATLETMHTQGQQQRRANRKE